MVWENSQAFSLDRWGTNNYHSSQSLAMEHWRLEIPNTLTITERIPL